jgi:type I restriction enzyme S subunit
MKFKPLRYFLMEQPRNGLYKGKEYQGTGSRWIKMKEVFSMDFISNDETSEKLKVTDSESERFSCKSGDLLFGRTSLTLEGVGDCLLVQDIIDEPIFESNLFRIRFDTSKAYPLFFYYFFKSHYGRQIIQRIAKQTAATSITASDLIAEDVPSFPLNVQVSIADLIYQFDKRNSLNHQTTKTLEQMAQALFKSWFVDFEPVIDNALATGNTIPDELQARAEVRKKAIAERATNPKLKPLPEDIKDLFPNEFEHCGDMSIGLVGWIPKGWKTVDV